MILHNILLNQIIDAHRLRVALYNTLSSFAREGALTCRSRCRLNCCLLRFFLLFLWRWGHWILGLLQHLEQKGTVTVS